MEAEVRGIYRKTGPVFSKVVEAGDATPIGGTTTTTSSARPT